MGAAKGRAGRGMAVVVLLGSCSLLFGGEERGEGVDDSHGLEAEVDDLGGQADDVLGVLG